MTSVRANIPVVSAAPYVGKPIEERVDIMASKMTIRSPFISAVFTTLPKRVVDIDDVTAGTDGTDFIFGRKFCEALDEEELLGLGVHEALHVVLGHIWRGEGYDHDLANTAQDAVINRMVLEVGFKLPPKGVLIDWVTSQMDWEEVYRRLKREQDEHQQGQPGNQQGGNQGGQGNKQGKPGKQPGKQPNQGTNQGPSPKEKWGAGGFNGKGDCKPCPTDAKKTEIEATILTAAKMARACGDQSAMIDRVLGMVAQPTVSWTDECRAMMLAAAKNDYSFNRCNKRLMAQGLYLPTLHGEKMGGLAVAFDMSGSISPTDANRIAAELQGVVDDCRPDWVEVAFFDTKICGVQRFEEGQPLELKPRGGGGTNFEPAFEHFDEVQKSEPICGMIFFTDMCADFSKLVEPAFPVLWGNIAGDDGHKVPFGRVVRIPV